jgi:hypothetical protein
MIDGSFQASAQASEPSTKTAKPISYIRTRPNMSPSRPTWVASSVMTSRKLMMTQTTADRSTCSPRWISGRASTTIVVSTAVISTPVMMTAIATPVRGAAWAFSDGLVTLGTDTRLSLTRGCQPLNERGLR